MAMMGLRVNQGPTLNLSSIFKNATVDPDTVVKMELAKSQILGQQHQNLLYDQQTELARQSAAKTAQEQADLAARAAYGEQAGIAVGEDFASKYPKPIPVDVTPRSAQQIIGPGPAIVTGEAQHSYDTGVAGARALARLYARSGASPEAIATAIQKQYGTDVLSAALTPGGPAAVGLTPDALRIGTTLATGNAPTTTTMITSEDTAPAVNAVREAAGKLPYDIALEQAKADAKANADLRTAPLGSSGSGPAAYRLAVLTAKEQTPAGLTPEEQQEKIQTQAIVDKANAVTPGKDAPIFVPDGKGGFTQVGGPVADPNATPPAYPGDSVAAADSNILLEVANDMARGKPIDPAKAQKYQLAFDRSWPEKAQIIHNADGTTQMIDPTPAPAGWPTKAAVSAAASLQGRAPLPQAAASILGVPSGMVPASALAAQTTGELSPLAKVVPLPSLEQGRDQAFASLMQQPALDMNEIGVNDLPSLAQAAQIIKDTAATNGSPGLFGAALDLASRDALLDPAARAYEQAVALWTSDSLYKLSGAAISPPEWVRQQLAMVPMYGDTQEQLLKKARARSNFLRVTAKQGWSADPASYKSFVDQTRLQGLELDYPVGALPPIHGPAAGEPRIPRGAPAGTPAAAGAAPATTAPVDNRPAPRTKPEKYQNLTDEQWNAVWGVLPQELKTRIRTQLGEP